MCTLVPYMNAFSLPDREKCPYKAKGERNRVPLLNPKLHSATTEQQKKLLPLNGSRWLGGDIVDHPVDTVNFRHYALSYPLQ